MPAKIEKQITQSVGKAAAKTFLQSFVSILSLLLVPVLMNWSTIVGEGGVIEIDGGFFINVLIAAAGAGVAALISFAQNALK